MAAPHTKVTWNRVRLYRPRECQQRRTKTNRDPLAAPERQPGSRYQKKRQKWGTFRKRSHRLRLKRVPDREEQRPPGSKRHTVAEHAADCNASRRRRKINNAKRPWNPMEPMEPGYFWLRLSTQTLPERTPPPCGGYTSICLWISMEPPNNFFLFNGTQWNQ